jgi:pimeloyl-ACP methyl ester carboxylesterase
MQGRSAGGFMAAKRAVRTKIRRPGPTVVLVHGAWADGSSWSEVIARLQAHSLRVVSVQNPLTSLADDVDAVSRVLELEATPVILVGHAWAGTVITQAGSASQVAALVYVAAFAPDSGQSTNDLLRDRPAPGYFALLKRDSSGYLWFPQEALPDWLAQDLPAENARLLASVQTPIHASVFDERVSEAAWRAKPTWYLVTDQDRIIDPVLQHEMASRIKANTATVPASHVPFASRPRETTELILEAVHNAVG